MSDLDPTDCETDHTLEPVEREVSLRTAADEDVWHVFSEHKTVNKYLIDHPAVDVTDVRCGESGAIHAVEADLPLALVGLKAKPPKDNIMSNVVSSGELRVRDGGDAGDE